LTALSTNVNANAADPGGNIGNAPTTHATTHQTIIHDISIVVDAIPLSGSFSIASHLSLNQSFSSSQLVSLTTSLGAPFQKFILDLQYPSEYGESIFFPVGLFITSAIFTFPVCPGTFHSIY
jgi:hypothetical protein